MRTVKIVLLITLILVALLYYFFGSLLFYDIFFSDIGLYLRWYSLFLVGSCSIILVSSYKQTKRETKIQHSIVFIHFLIFLYFFLIYFQKRSPIVSIRTIVTVIILYILTYLPLFIRILFFLCFVICYILIFLHFVSNRYNYIPSLDSFYDRFGIHLHLIVKDAALVLRDVQAQIKIYAGNNTNPIVIPISANYVQDHTYKFYKPLRVHFLSSKPLYNTFVFIQLYDGSIFTIPSQSVGVLEYTGGIYIFSLTGLHSNDILNASHDFIAYHKIRLQSYYTGLYQQYLLESMGGKRIQNPIFNAFLSGFLFLATTLLPNVFSQTYTNYQEFKKQLHISHLNTGINIHFNLFKDFVDIRYINTLIQSFMSALKQAEFIRSLGD